MQSSASNIQQALGLQRIDPEARVGVAADKVDAMKELRAELQRLRTDYGEALAEAKQAKEANAALRQQLGSAQQAAGGGGQGKDQEALQVKDQHLDGKLKQLQKF